MPLYVYAATVEIFMSRRQMDVFNAINIHSILEKLKRIFDRKDFRFSLKINKLKGI